MEAALGLMDSFSASNVVNGNFPAHHDVLLPDGTSRETLACLANHYTTIASGLADLKGVPPSDLQDILALSTELKSRAV